LSQTTEGTLTDDETCEEEREMTKEWVRQSRRHTMLINIANYIICLSCLRDLAKIGSIAKEKSEEDRG
jgi:hypothetical protein